MNLRLEAVNPSIKAAAVLLCVIMLSFIYNPYTPALFYIIIAGGVLSAGRVPLKNGCCSRFRLSFWPSVLYGQPPYSETSRQPEAICCLSSADCRQQ